MGGGCRAKDAQALWFRLLERCDLGQKWLLRLGDPSVGVLPIYSPLLLGAELFVLAKTFGGLAFVLSSPILVLPRAARLAGIALLRSRLALECICELALVARLVLAQIGAFLCKLGDVLAFGDRCVTGGGSLPFVYARHGSGR